MNALHALYRYFDAIGRLLYIGISGDLAVRDTSHISRSRWMQLTASSTVERYGTLEEVKRAEQEAVQAECPLFNVQYNDTPEARERLRAYLEEIGRPDLITSQITGTTRSQDTDRDPAGLTGWFPPVITVEDETCRIQVIRGPQVMLQMRANNLQTTVYLGPDLAFKLAKALTDQASEVCFAEFVNDGEVDAGPWAPAGVDECPPPEPTQALTS